MAESVEQPDLGGRPRLFDDPEKMQEAVDQYFKEGVKLRTVIVGKPPNASAVTIPVPTITGLCNYLGFDSRQSFYDYEKYPGFSYTVKRARLFIEQEYEEQLQHGNTVGAIFALKNLGWRDKIETGVTDKDGNDVTIFEIPHNGRT